MSFEEEENELSIVTDDDNIVPSDKIASQTVAELESELSKFRLEWKKELKIEKQPDENEFLKSFNSNENAKNVEISQRSKNIGVHQSFPQRNRPELKAQIETSSESSDLNYEQPKTNEEKAKYLFNKGVILEQQSRHYEAIKFYRMAIQLDADIEFKMAFNKQPKSKSEIKPKTDVQDAQEIDSNKIIEHVEEEDKTLYEKFKEFIDTENKFCTKFNPQKTLHFSDLPLEVIVLILKWVVSEHLDMRSLDNFAAVCKGFYVCGRDPEIWKLACAKTWGANNIKNYLSQYSSWREMFLKKPRLNLDGVYISKTTYAREGERSLDNFYKPWHLVEFYRYFRFFPNGTVLFLTSPDEPKIVVSKLKQSNTPTSNTTAGFYNQFISNEQSVLKGTWTLAFNKVSIVLVRKIQIKNTLASKTGRKKEKETFFDQEHLFRMELELAGKMNNQLQWKNYDIDVTNKASNTVNTTKFDLNKIDFPNFYFSRVKSYSLNTDVPLK